MGKKKNNKKKKAAAPQDSGNSEADVEESGPETGAEESADDKGGAPERSEEPAPEAEAEAAPEEEPKKEPEPEPEPEPTPEPEPEPEPVAAPAPTPPPPPPPPPPPVSSASGEEVSRLEKKNEELVAENRRLQQRLDEATSNEQAAKSNVETLKKRLADAEVASVSGGDGDGGSAFREQLVQLRVDRDRYQEEAQVKAAELTKVRMELSNTANSADRREEAASRKAEDAANDRVNGLQEAIRKLQFELKDKEDVIAAKDLAFEQERKAVKAQLDGTDKRGRSNDPKSMAQMEREIARLEADLQVYTQKVAMLEGIKGEVESLADENCQLKLQIQSLKEQGVIGRSTPPMAGQHAAGAGIPSSSLRARGPGGQPIMRTRSIDRFASPTEKLAEGPAIPLSRNDALPMSANTFQLNSTYGQVRRSASSNGMPLGGMGGMAAPPYGAPPPTYGGASRPSFPHGPPPHQGGHHHQGGPPRHGGHLFNMFGPRGGAPPARDLLDTNRG